MIAPNFGEGSKQYFPEMLFPFLEVLFRDALSQFPNAPKLYCILSFRVLSTSEDETEQPSTSAGSPGSVFKRGGLSTM